MKWTLSWPNLRDVGITGTGLAIIWVQLLLWVLSGRLPSDVLLAVGLGLTVPSARHHVKTVLAAPEAGSSSPSSPPASSPPSLSSPPPGEGTGE